MTVLKGSAQNIQSDGLSGQKHRFHAGFCELFCQYIRTANPIESVLDQERR